ncbi:unnamed protein product [Fusarium graminearum]|nr:unnamed protein product [Fusarium graminearum]
MPPSAVDFDDSPSWVSDPEFHQPRYPGDPRCRRSVMPELKVILSLRHGHRPFRWGFAIVRTAYGPGSDEQFQKVINILHRVVQVRTANEAKGVKADIVWDKEARFPRENNEGYRSSYWLKLVDTETHLYEPVRVRVYGVDDFKKYWFDRNLRRLPMSDLTHKDNDNDPGVLYFGNAPPWTMSKISIYANGLQCKLLAANSRQNPPQLYPVPPHPWFPDSLLHNHQEVHHRNQHPDSTRQNTTNQQSRIDKMPSPPPKPSSPIPFRRNRAQTMDEVWPPANHPHQGYLPLDAFGLNSVPLGTIVDNSSSSSAEAATEQNDDPFYTTSPAKPANGPLHVVDTMRLQVVRDQKDNTLGMRVTDPNNTMGKDANVCAPLPLGKTTTGIAFSVGSPQAMNEAYKRATKITDSQRIVGVMFAPTKEQGKVRDVDWSVLETAKDCENDTVPALSTARTHGIGNRRSRRRHTTANAFGEPPMSPTSKRANMSDDSEIEGAGIDLRQMVKEMTLEDKKGEK